MKLLNEIINRAKSAIGKGEVPDPKAALARKRMKAEMDLKKFRLNEEMLQERQNSFRTQAKRALAEGNDREYELINAKFKSASGGLKMASAAVDATSKIITLMDSQETMSSIVEMSKTVAEMKDSSCIDPETMEDAVMNIRESMALTETVSNSMSSISDMVTGSDEMTMGDPLKAELMAEIQAEQSVQSFGDKIKDEMKELE